MATEIEKFVYDTALKSMKMEEIKDNWGLVSNQDGKADMDNSR